MRFIESFWDDEIIGKKSGEIIFDGPNCLEEFAALDLSKFGYVVCKVPVGLLKITEYLETTGFNFIEQQFEVLLNIKRDLFLPERYTRFIDEFEAFESKEDMYRKIIEAEIKKRIFRTDRVFVDFRIPDSENKSVLRYLNWLNGIYSANTRIFLINKKGTNQIVGFHIFQSDAPGCVDALLGGMFSEYASLGLGFIFIYMPLLELKKQGYTRASTRISSNNTVHHHYFNLGYQLHKIYTVFRRIG